MHLSSLSIISIKTTITDVDENMRYKLKVWCIAFQYRL